MRQPIVSFISSCTDLRLLPPADKPEYAFAGRSNVGKSSLLNFLAGNKKLARTSQTPGKTQVINHFLADQSWYLADLPGYGYARVSKSSRMIFNRLIQEYILCRDNLMCLFVLIDCRHEPQTSDMDFINWLGENGIPLSIIFTKTDKVSGPVLEKNFQQFRKVMLQGWTDMPDVFMTSALAHTGKKELLRYIYQLNKQFKTGEKKR